MAILGLLLRGRRSSLRFYGNDVILLSEIRSCGDNLLI